MRHLLDAVPGTRLDRVGYKSDFRERFWVPGSNFVKLEVQQTFAEPDDSSWRAAFVDGDWERALYLIDGKRPEYEQDKQRMHDLGITSRRLRVVALPLSSYLEWELRVLELMGAISDEIRVLDASHVRTHATGGVLPEVVVLDDTTTYEVLYDHAGVLSGAIRRSDAGLAAFCRELINAWYDLGEDIGAFCTRQLSALPPPDLTR
ncbi:DUF6879 family protein [Catenuloplanes japonicus]|uniref:DUF6879 family protein n=1 Tax=Catenuloplanes japonicus TaxID=33876 RepID=UPI00068C547E|nr:DUF6879 family protein [Catenuloplanes japonicus]